MNIENKSLSNNLLNLTVGIVGVGVVGNAVSKSFIKHNIKTVLYDKYKNIGSIDDLFETNFIFLCLPTPFKDTEYDKSAINEVCQYLSNKKYKGLVIVKSTVEPETSEKLSKEYNLNICHNPEFLTARSAEDDFENQKHIVIGKTSSCDNSLVELLKYFYMEHYPEAKISLSSSNESETMKLGVNNFYSVKVQFFTEIYLLCQKLGTSYEKVRDMMLINGWIIPEHTNIPGPDGQISYGGMCFPKDTNALLNYMKRKELPNSVIDGTVKERNTMRDNLYS